MHVTSGSGSPSSGCWQRGVSEQRNDPSYVSIIRTSAPSHAWRQHPGQEDAPTADLAFVMRHVLSASQKPLKSRQDLQALALKGCWGTAGTASLAKGGREWLG